MNDKEPGARSQEMYNQVHGRFATRQQRDRGTDGMDMGRLASTEQSQQHRATPAAPSSIATDGTFYIGEVFARRNRHGSTPAATALRSH
jgi:hypothetical protein